MIDYVCYVQGVSNVFKGTGRPLSPHSEQFGKWEEFSCLLLFFFFPISLSQISFQNFYAVLLTCCFLNSTHDVPLHSYLQALN